MLVALAAVLVWWLRWNVIRTRERKEFITYLQQLEHEQHPTTTWLVRWDDDDRKIPWVWRLMGATHGNWATWLLCNGSLGSDDLERANRLLPDCQITVNPPTRPPRKKTES